MEEEKRVIKVPVKDKRRLAQEGDKVAEETPGVVSHEGGGQVLMDESSDVEQQPVPAPGEAAGDAPGDPGTPPEPRLSVDELQRLKADLDNTRKRMIREQSRALEYATKDVMKRLIPVIDHFRLAIEHGEGGSGIELWRTPVRSARPIGSEDAATTGSGRVGPTTIGAGWPAQA